MAISLMYIYGHLKENGNPDGYDAWNSLQTLFRTLDEGNPNLDIPLFNGGLFARLMARMLDQPKVMTNAEVLELLDLLYGESSTGYIRDFSSLSVIQLGRIYESLLEFEFRIAEENLWYFTYKERQNGKIETIDGYFDTEDYERIKNAKRCKITSRVKEYIKDDVYLVGGKNSRKQSASYYTPQSLSRPLVKMALDDAVAKLGEDESLLDIRILDNACGSGHLLIESLQYLTQIAIGRIDTDKKLKAVLEDEKKRIDETLKDLGVTGLGINVDEFAVLKRILLKRTIYGVDLQPFAVELAKLSLWIETFVFGTPLSFIEHHVKAGNSLAGCPISRVRRALGSGQGHLLDQTISQSFSELTDIFKKLNQLQDTTAADITASKTIYQTEIRPKLEEMGKYFDLLNAGDLLLAESEADRKMAAETPTTGDDPGENWKEKWRKSATDKKNAGEALIKNYVPVAENFHSQSGDWREKEKLIHDMRERYVFFNWELEFPEVFAGTGKGFHIIIGNPPWDKTKFSDPDFMSQYRSNYRQLSNNNKRRVARELLAKPFIRDRYKKQRNGILATNEYYKNNFPWSKGAGDGNLFRFFVENNLRLLRKGGTLNYVIPTALWTDEGSTALREHIIDKYWLRNFYGFENREGLFPDVHLSYKFGLMRIERPAESLAEKDANTRFMLTSPAELENRDRNFTYTPDDINVTSPKWHALMEIRNRDELDIMRKIHGCGYSYLDPGWIDFRNELHATIDKKIFHENCSSGMIPLYKGACIWQFDSEYWNQAADGNKNEYWLKPDEFDKYILSKERRRIIDDIYPQLQASPKKSKTKNVLDFIGLKDEKELEQFVVYDREYPRLAFRAIASDTNERTIVASVIPAQVGAQNSLWMSIPKRYVLKGKKIGIVEYDLKVLFFAQAFFNSIVFDWVMRCSIAMNVNKTYIWRMPMPQPDVTEIENKSDFMKLARNSLRLSAFYNEKAFGPLFGQFGMDGGWKITERKIADMTRRENDLIIANMYGLERKDMEVILDTFSVMRDNRPGYAEALLEMIH